MEYSFVLPAWKGKYLQDALTSILVQTYKDFELIVVDDHSPEDIKGIVEGFNDNRLKYYRNKENIGGHDLVAQWNHCLEYAKGEYVILATDDDLYEPNFLETMADLIAKYPNVNLLRARVLQVDANNKVRDIDACYKEYLTKDEFVYHILHGMRGGIPQYVFKTSALRKKGGFVSLPLAWGADDATAIMMSERGVATAQDHLVRFRWSSVNISSDRKSMPTKIKARLMFCQWLRKNLKPIKVTDEKTAFLHKHIDEYLPVYNKVTLISNISHLPVDIKKRCLSEVWNDNTMSKKDKLSVVIHCIVK